MSETRQNPMVTSVTYLLLVYVADGTCISSPCWNFIQGIDNNRAIIFDLYPDTALNVSVEDVNIRPYNGTINDAKVICNATSLVPGEQDTLGFKCETGPLVVTNIQAGTGNGGVGMWNMGASVTIKVSAAVTVLSVLFLL